MSFSAPGFDKSMHALSISSHCGYLTNTASERAIRPVNTAACDPVKTHFSVVPGHKESYFNKYPTPLCAADAS